MTLIDGKELAKKIRANLKEDVIELKNIDPVINEEGKENSPYTLTVTNICEEKKELQIRLNVLSETTFDTKALTIEAAGNIELETILYKN